METEYIFYAEAIEGYSFKALINFLKNSFNYNINLHFKVNKDGIFINLKQYNYNALIMNFSFFSKNMDVFVYNYKEEEFVFNLSSYLLIEIEEKINFAKTNKNYLVLSVKFGKPWINIKTINNCWGEFHPSYDLNFLKEYKSYNCEIPSEYYDFPQRNRKISIKWSKKLISRFNYKPTNVTIKLKKNSIEFLFPNYYFIFIGEAGDSKILYEDVFDVNQIENILKILSYRTIRIYYDKNLPLLFSSPSEGSHIYISVSPNTRFGEIKYKIEPRIFKNF